MVDAEAWGVEAGYHDGFGTWHDSAPEVVSTVLEIMGAGTIRPSGDASCPGLTVRLDRPLPTVPAGTLRLEDGTTLSVSGPLPPDLPIGYHALQPQDGEVEQPLVVSPGRCPSPNAEEWGWAAQLYATRSQGSWGMGDLADLRDLAEWSSTLGARLLLINPLHAATPSPPLEPSPYSASSRIFSNPLYLRVEEIPGASDLNHLDELAAAGRALNSERHIDRDRVWALKSQALEELFESFGGDHDFDAFRLARGATLEGFTTFCALAERHGAPWQSWPEPFRRPDLPAVAAFESSTHGDRRRRFYAWLQWHLDRQLAAASRSLDLIHDLAIGVEPGGADAWLWQDTFAVGARVGAPPDEFNALGQNWGLPPWDPWKLRLCGFTPFVETVRAGLRNAGGLRFDHVMGLFRLYWIPLGCGADHGVYVRYPHQDLLNILALEATRASAFVVGEDLGTVGSQVRREMAERRILSYRVLWFEHDRPDHWPESALAAVTTHDLPTVAGVWTGADLDAQRRLDLAPSEEPALALRARLQQWTDCDDTAPVEDVIERTYELLAGAPCTLRTATLEDALAVNERPNMPGTIGTWPNWSIALPLPLEELQRSALALGVATRLAHSHSRREDQPSSPAA